MLIKLICEKTKKTIPARLARVEDPERISNLHNVLHIANNPPNDLFTLLLNLSYYSTGDASMYKLLIYAAEHAKKGNTAEVMRCLTMYKDE